MATALLSPAIKALNSCCGDGLGKIFHKDDDEDVPPAAAKPNAASKPTGAKPSGKKLGRSEERV